MSKRTTYLDQLKKDLAARRGEWPRIAREAEVSYSWITKLMQGLTTNPRIQECERVRKVLKKH